MGLRVPGPLSTSLVHALGRHDRALSRSIERLSTGLRINRASDDPSGLVISEQLRNQIAGLQQSIENSRRAMP